MGTQIESPYIANDRRQCPVRLHVANLTCPFEVIFEVVAGRNSDLDRDEAWLPDLFFEMLSASRRYNVFDLKHMIDQYDSPVNNLRGCLPGDR